MNNFMLAGVSSNVGKTTVTMGIMAALCKRGEAVVPFKTGPDYIDPMFHTFVTGQSSTNLDTWMVEEKIIQGLYYHKLKEDSVGIVEGVMGLYDGQGKDDDVGSSAYLSKVLDIPVFLIIDGRGMSKSAAAMVKGYVDFDPRTKIAGVIINRIRTQSHYDLLRSMIETFAGVPCVGWFPDCADLTMNSRHLGLIPVDELEDIKTQVDRAGALAEAYVDLDQMLAISHRQTPPEVAEDPFDAHKNQYAGITLGVAKDKAFNFYYEDNFLALKKLGVTLVPVSPLEDSTLPAGVDALYLGGGFPEVFGEALQKNLPFRQAMKAALEEGLPCFAECGGLMVLTKSLQTKEGESYEGVGFLDADTVMTKALQRFGYVTVEARLGGQTIHTRAHEFHHSLVAGDEALKTAYTVSKRGKIWHCGYVKANTLAGYPHIHFYSNPQFLLALLGVVVTSCGR